MSAKEDYEKPTIKPTGLHGIRGVTSVRLEVMIEKLIEDIVLSPHCNGLSAQQITDEITYGLNREYGWGEDIKAYVEATRATKGNP